MSRNCVSKQKNRTGLKQILSPTEKNFAINIYFKRENSSSFVSPNGVVLGVSYQPLTKLGSILSTISNEINFMVGEHHSMRNFIKGSQCEEG